MPTLLTARALVIVSALILTSVGAVLAVGILSSPTASDYGVDTDGNGLYDWLVVEASMDLSETGIWDLSATLASPEASPCGFCILPPEPGAVAASTMPYYYGAIGSFYGREFLEEGPRVVRFAFVGTEIRHSGMDGPYLVQGVLSLSGGPWMYDVRGMPWGSDTVVRFNYTTRPYAAEAFEEPPRPVRFTGTHSDAGVDLDGDGLFDFLEIQAGVDVREEGAYLLTGTLSSSEGFGDATAVRVVAYASRDLTLSAADGTVSLRFRGDQIRQAGVDGPWAFDLTLTSPYVYILGSGSGPEGGFAPAPMPYPEILRGTTNAYRAEDFDSSVELARYTGAFEEVPEDWDLDGLYEALTIRVQVEVLAPSAFDISGALRTADGNRNLSFTAGTAWLPEGEGWVSFTFPGSEIRASGVDGPYNALLSLTPSTTRMDPTTAYLTRAYRATDFEAEKIPVPTY